MSERARPRESGYLADSTGWQLWNMSTRISHAKRSARLARTKLADPAVLTSWSPGGRGALAELSAALDRCAADCDALWARLRAAAARTDPTLVQPTDAGIAVIRNHGADPATMQALRRVWGEGHACVRDGYDLYERFRRLVVAEEGSFDPHAG